MEYYTNYDFEKQERKRQQRQRRFNIGLTVTIAAVTGALSGFLAVRNHTPEDVQATAFPTPITSPAPEFTPVVPTPTPEIPVPTPIPTETIPTPTPSLTPEAAPIPLPLPEGDNWLMIAEDGFGLEVYAQADWDQLLADCPYITHPLKCTAGQTVDVFTNLEYSGTQYYLNAWTLDGDDRRPVMSHLLTAGVNTLTIPKNADQISIGTLRPQGWIDPES